MASITSIALSGMTAAQARLNTSAHNIANLNTEGFVRQELDQQAQAQGGVSTVVRAADAPGASLEADVVSQLQAKHVFLANLAVFKSQDKMAGALLDQQV
ncbi:MAG: flagellar basal body rod protein [Rhodoferax sp.]|uniref:flagellar basal body protein n=1 Tax=Rhodoferax sp. TaxID=50421 RepID=UPI001B40E432|nr:flagellar basal body protein [Rhodoferax sp.]MBP9150065.1 flagellar basal body rod protein [Rhodoferax sp.]MBP9735370.1 flagellar basal body rod protein [Rhodoferax sp.]